MGISIFFFVSEMNTLVLEFSTLEGLSKKCYSNNFSYNMLEHLSTTSLNLKFCKKYFETIRVCVMQFWNENDFVFFFRDVMMFNLNSLSLSWKKVRHCFQDPFSSTHKAQNFVFIDISQKHINLYRHLKSLSRIICWRYP